MSVITRIASGSSRSSYLRAVKYAYGFASSPASSTGLARTNHNAWSVSDEENAIATELRAYPIQIPEDVLNWRPRTRSPSGERSAKKAGREHKAHARGPVLRASEEIFLQEDVAAVDPGSTSFGTGEALRSLDTDISAVHPTLPDELLNIATMAKVGKKTREGSPRRIRPTQAPSPVEGPYQEALTAYHDRYAISLLCSLKMYPANIPIRPPMQLS